MYLKDAEIISESINKLEKEFDDFNSFSKTDVFKGLFEIYKNEKDKDNKLDYNNICVMANIIGQELIEKLKSFCSQSTALAYSVLKARQSFTSCLAFIISNMNMNKRSAHIDTNEVWAKALNFYLNCDVDIIVVSKISLTGETDTVMQLNFNKGLELSPISLAELEEIKKAYSELGEKANEEKKAKKLADKIAKAKQEEKEKSKSKKKKKTKKQTNLFADETSSDADTDADTNKAKADEIQLTLF